MSKEATAINRDAKDRARRACQILIEEIGAEGPADVDVVAERAAVLIRELRDQVNDYASLEEDAARVVLAYLHGDKTELDEAVHALKSNGRHEWWKKYKPIGLRGQDDV